MDSYKNLLLARLNNERYNKQEYQSIISTQIQLATITRLDISFTLRRLSSYVSDLTTRHMRAFKKLTRYLRSNLDISLRFSKLGARKLVSYMDLDYVMDKLDRVSILGYVFFLYRALISQISKKQKSIATLIMEAKYMAIGAYTKQS